MGTGDAASPVRTGDATHLPGTSPVVGLGRARVKGTHWEWLDGAAIDAGGVVGDRSWALVDENLQCLKTARHPELIRLDASSIEDLSTITRVDESDGGSSSRAGRVGASNGRLETTAAPSECMTVDYWGRPIEAELFDHPWCAAASEATGVPVRLARATSRPGFIWEYPVSVLLLGELTGLPGLCPDGSVDWDELRRYRPNVVLDDRAVPLGLHDGSVLRIGDVELTCRERLGRCTVINHGPAGNDRLFQSLTTTTLGWGCEVTRPGDVSCGTVAHLAG